MKRQTLQRGTHQWLAALAALAFSVTACSGDDAVEDSESWRLGETSQTSSNNATSDNNHTEPPDGETSTNNEGMTSANNTSATSAENNTENNGANNTTPPPPPGASPLQACDVEPLWWSSHGAHDSSPAFFRITPDESAVIHDQRIYRLRDGAPMIDGSLMLLGATHRVPIAASQDWGVSIERAGGIQDPMQRDEMLVVTGRDGSKREYPLGESSRDLRSYPPHVRISADGSRFATLICSQDGRNTPYLATLRAFDVATGAVLLEEDRTNPSDCVNIGQGDGPHIAVLEDGSAVVFIDLPSIDERPGSSVTAILYDLESPDVAPVLLDITSAFDELRDYQRLIASLEATPQGTFRFVTYEGGIFDLDPQGEWTLEELPERRGAYQSNTMSFEPPQMASPQAWTEDGALTAFVATDGDVVVQDIETGAEALRLEAAEPSSWYETLMNPGDDVPINVPVAIAFAQEDQAIIVSFKEGIGAWGCPQALPSPPQEKFDLLVTADITDRVPINTSVRASIALEGVGALSGYLTAFKLYADGELVTTSFTQNLEWIAFRERGTAQMVVEVDDGWYTWRTEPQTLILE